MNWVRKLASKLRADEPPPPPHKLSKKEQAAMRRLEGRIGYQFRDQGLLEKALTHPSRLDDKRAVGEDNQRMEFLGDAVLGMILAERLFRLFPDEDEGKLTQARSVLARGEQLCALARKLKLQQVILMNRGELRSKGNERESTLEDALESLVGAIYLDAGMRATRKVVLAWHGDIEKTLAKVLTDYNPKGRLQEKVQALIGPDRIEYVVVKQEGPAHRRRFTVAARVSGQKQGVGVGSSKKEAEEDAARKALKTIERSGRPPKRRR